jgi:hypothetical protein
LDIDSIVSDLKSEMDRISRAISLLVGGAVKATSPKGAKTSKRGRKRGLTAAGRRALSIAMKKRWAERRGKTMAKAAAPKRRGGLTAAGRKKLSEAMKKRWAERRKKQA